MTKSTPNTKYLLNFDKNQSENNFRWFSMILILIWSNSQILKIRTPGYTTLICVKIYCDFDIFTAIFILLKSQIYWNLPFFSDYWKLLKLSPSTEITEIEISFLVHDHVRDLFRRYVVSFWTPWSDSTISVVSKKENENFDVGTLGYVENNLWVI